MDNNIYTEWWCPLFYVAIIAERRERSERSEANNRVLFEIPRYLYIYIYTVQVAIYPTNLNNII